MREYTTKDIGTIDREWTWKGMTPCEHRDSSDWSCTLSVGHSGAHVAHKGSTKEILSVWHDAPAINIEAWKIGGCAACGGYDRNGGAWAHGSCYAGLNQSERLAIQKACHAARAIRACCSSEIGNPHRDGCRGEVKSAPELGRQIKRIDVAFTLPPPSLPTVDQFAKQLERQLADMFDKTNHGLLPVSDRAYRFLCGLRLDDQPVTVQRQYNEITTALGNAIAKARGHERGSK
jgi:hypothetical protein